MGLPLQGKAKQSGRSESAAYVEPGREPSQGRMELYTDRVICSSMKNNENAPLVLHALEDHPKFRSVVALGAARLPVRDMTLLPQWTSSPVESVDRFVESHGVDRVLVRSEARGGRLASPSRQGVERQAIGSAVLDLLQTPGAVVGIQIAGNVFKNLHNLNLMVSPFQPGQVLLEIVGPGFTATDLNRFGVVHERIEVPSFAIELHESLVRRTYVVPDWVYKSDRLAKIESVGYSRLVREDALILSRVTHDPIPLGYLRTIWPDLADVKTGMD